ncbi:MAG: hypothetical protein ACAI43_10495 [Phycisphaerae bacterium]|nr:hypothetical protein [Tepidisphaeraceae bacterium]
MSRLARIILHVAAAAALLVIAAPMAWLEIAGPDRRARAFGFLWILHGKNHLFVRTPWDGQHEINLGAIRPFCWMVLILWACAAIGRRLWARALVDRATDRYIRGHCPACDYDLRGSPGRCPECGADRSEAAGLKPDV